MINKELDWRAIYFGTTSQVLFYACALNRGVNKFWKRNAFATSIFRYRNNNIIATTRKKEIEARFPEYIEKAETGAIGRALAMCGYGTLQAPEFDEQDRLADAPVEKAKDKN